MRTFIAIDIPKDIRKEIVKIQEKLPLFKGKRTELENLHLTLKFLGEVNDNRLESIKKKLSEIKMEQFESEIRDIGMFSDRIIWLGIRNCDELQKAVDGTLKGLFEEERRFMGHLTIARVKKIENKKDFREKIRKIKVPKIKFLVESFSLKKSKLSRKGPVYEDIEVYKLKI